MIYKNILVESTLKTIPLEVDIYCKKRKDPTDNEELIFLDEVNFVCPLCGKELIKMEKRG